ncbi:hypothetical protein ACHAXS_001791 [Conticribra weissflogii]
MFHCVERKSVRPSIASSKQLQLQGRYCRVVLLYIYIISSPLQYQNKPQAHLPPTYHRFRRVSNLSISMSFIVTSEVDDSNTSNGSIEVLTQARTETSKTEKSHRMRKKPTRPICPTCNFPPRTCICSALPEESLSSLFRKCRIVVLQHPHELRRKNRSLPLVELCLHGKEKERKPEFKSEPNINNEAFAKNEKSTEISMEKDDNFVMKTIVGRRFGSSCDSSVMEILQNPDGVVVLVFPHPKAMDLEEGLALAEKRCGFENCGSGEDKRKKSTREGHKYQPKKKITLIFLDATWKHAREMDNKNEAAGVWPDHLIRVQLTPSVSNAGDKGETDTTSNANEPKPDFIQRRFHIRAPPSPDHLSTAECLAWVASRVEGNPLIFESIMKVLDYMVELWRGFANCDCDKE